MKARNVMALSIFVFYYSKKPNAHNKHFKSVCIVDVKKIEVIWFESDKGKKRSAKREGAGKLQFGACDNCLYQPYGYFLTQPNRSATKKTIFGS